MAFNEILRDRIREVLAGQSLISDPVIEEKAMFGGLCFMVNDKMCICVGADGLLCRIGKAAAAKQLEMGGCRQTVMGSRPMKDFVDVDEHDVQSAEALRYWVNRCLEFNREAKPSQRRKSENKRPRSGS